MQIHILYEYIYSMYTHTILILFSSHITAMSDINNSSDDENKVTFCNNDAHVSPLSGFGGIYSSDK
jgi:hypothetical protein